jgi:dolichol-phosphate mannosyltransferase
MKPEDIQFQRYHLAVVIPAYRVEREIETVLTTLPDYFEHVIVVDDCSPDSTSERVKQVAAKDKRIILLRHERNQGVGGAMITGFKKALEVGAQIVVKLDGDGQMDPAHIPALVTPLICGKADYVKGNRFRDFQALRQMPAIRRLGNMAMSFFAKAATGYWNCFDPTNGFFAIRSEVLAMLPFKSISRTYYFETSMLAELYMLDAFVQDVPLPARYQDEVSNIVVHRIVFEFPYRLMRTFLRRIVLKNFLYDFSMASVYLLTGMPLLLFGLIFGIIKWIDYASRDVPAPTGTVMLATLPVILGIQILLSAASIDLHAVPKEPLTDPLE